MSVNDEQQQLPWLTGEQHAIAEAVWADMPYGCVCLATFQRHGEIFAIPDDTTQLACSHSYQNQAFVWQRAHALLFHIEVSRELARQWLALLAYQAELAAANGNDAIGPLLASLDQLDRLVPLAQTPFSRFVDTVVQPLPSA